MSDRERLIERILNTPEKEYPVVGGRLNGKTYRTAEMIADHILSDGWVRPPCKVGDTVYCINTFFQSEPRINECEVDALHITSGKNIRGHKTPSYALVRSKNMRSLTSRIYFEKFGVSAFLTRKEAEQALAERQGKNEKP